MKQKCRTLFLLPYQSKVSRRHHFVHRLSICMSVCLKKEYKVEISRNKTFNKNIYVLQYVKPFLCICSNIHEDYLHFIDEMFLCQLVRKDRFAVLRRVSVSTEDNKKKTWAKGLDPAVISIIVGTYLAVCYL